MTGGLIAGNRPEQRLARLRSFWELAAEEDMIFLPFTQTAGRTGKKRSVLTTLFAGRPGLFRPSAPGIWSVLPFGFTDESVLNTDPQRETLTRLIDFDLLGGGMVPLIVTAVDIETGEEVAFDSRRGSLTLDHIMASTAFPVVFPPVTIGDRTFFDPGIVSNLPLLTLFSKEPQEEVLCICLDLSPQRGQVPTSLDETVRRRPTCCSEARADALRELTTLHRARDGPPITVIHVAYGIQSEEVGLKTFDFSRQSHDMRWEAGRQAALRLLDAIENPPVRRQS
ncbi:patatin-like phospholipase family protein [Rhizobium laguerreae]|nr:patatin-like phospholipase family protein [Rhizobium laguerreae]